jgi:uncharacterized protein YcbX
MRVGVVRELWWYPVKSMAGYRREPCGDEVLPVAIALGDGRVAASDDAWGSQIISRALGRRVTLWPRRPAEDLAHYRRAEPITDFAAAQGHEKGGGEFGKRASRRRRDHEGIPNLSKLS